MPHLEPEFSVAAKERAVARKTLQREHESLLHILRCHCMQLLEEIRTLTHELADHFECLSRIFSHERAELRAAHEECLGLFRRACVRHIDRIRGDSFDAERLTGSHYRGNKTSA